MGYFVLSLKDTVEDKLEAALKNIELWEVYGKGEITKEEFDRRKNDLS